MRGLLNHGQEPALLIILSYLNWFDLALILSLIPLAWQERHLAFLAVSQTSSILTVNSGLDKRAGSNLSFLIEKKYLSCYTFFHQLLINLYL